MLLTAHKCIKFKIIKGIFPARRELIYEPRYEKTGFLHMRKQRRRSASR